MKIRNLIQKEFKIANQPPPKDKADYKAKMSTIQDLQKNPKLRDPESQANIMKRKSELDTWAKKNLKKEDEVSERMPASIIKHKEKLAHMSDEELANHFKDKDDNTLRQMAWRHGYGKMSDYYVNRKNKGMSQDTNEGAMRMDKSAFVQMLANKIQEPQKGQGKPEYDNRLLAKMYKLITGRDVDIDGDKFTITMNKPTTETQEDADIDAQFKSDVLQFLNSKVVQIEKQIELTPAKTPEEKENKEFALKLFNFVQAKLEQKDNGDNTITVPKSMMKKEDLDYRSEDILNKAGFDPADIDTYMKVFNDHGDTTDIKQMNMKEKVGLADVMSIVLASHGIQNK